MGCGCGGDITPVQFSLNENMRIIVKSARVDAVFIKVNTLNCTDTRDVPIACNDWGRGR